MCRDDDPGLFQGLRLGPLVSLRQDRQSNDLGNGPVMTGQDHCHTRTDGVPIKSWTHGVPVEDKAWQQLRNVAALPFVQRHIAVMPDVHCRLGATVGSVIPTKGAIVPAAVGVDIPAHVGSAMQSDALFHRSCQQRYGTLVHQSTRQ